MSRSAAVDPADLLASEAWPLLVAAREGDDATLVEQARDLLRSIPTLDPTLGDLPVRPLTG